MYQNYQQNGFQNQVGSYGGSQYRGLDARYQPIGYVQSQYNQSLGMNGSNMYQHSNQHAIQNQAASFQGQSPDAYHTANYRGNQPGHDAYLRSDSTQPAQSQYGIGAGNQISSFNHTNSPYGFYAQSYNQPNPNTFQMSNYQGSPYGSNQQQNQSYTQFQNPQSFHTANYRGNQPGHDAYLRSDSTQPSQSMQSQYGTNNQAYGRYQF